jgi:hypothetical protein
MSKQTRERRIRGGVVMAELGAEDLQQFLLECQRQRRASGHLAGTIISTWLKREESLREQTPVRQ